jgi:arylsulfatase A-like enzyme
MQTHVSVLLIILLFSQLLRAQDKPNILWITVEDISPTLSMYGDSTAHTPNLDRLASEGVTFTNVCSPSGVCAPSRSAIITGMYPTSIGTHNMRTNWATPEDIPEYEAVIPSYVKAFPEYLRQAGYFCTNNKKNDYQFKSPITAWDQNHDSAHYINRQPGQPFFSVFNSMLTHESRLWKHKDRPLLVDPNKVKVPPYYPDSKLVRNTVARNYSNIMEMDTWVGEVLDELEDKNLLDSTIIFFYSDHGGPLPRQKREINTIGVRVPLIIRFPNAKWANTINEELVSFLDFAPTVLDFAGVDVPEHLQGRKFIGSNKEPEPKYLFAARDRLDILYDLVRSVRNRNFTYIRNYDTTQTWYMDIPYRKNLPMMVELLSKRDSGALEEDVLAWFSKTRLPEELYDRTSDPDELFNLVGNPSYEEILNEFRRAHLEWQQTYGDLGFIPERVLVQNMWPNFEQPTTQKPAFEIRGGYLHLASCTEGASIAYRVLGDLQECPSWQVYTKPIELTSDLALEVKAIRIGYKESETIIVKSKGF